MAAMRDLWIRWKMLRLPWRKRFLIGQDLHGNTFWEFKDAINHNRWRRIVKASRRTHFSDVQISPQWHQWLRQTRSDPPSIQEQAADLQRIAQMKHNAQLADERWASKAKYIEKPKPTTTPQLNGDPQFDRAQIDQDPAPSPTSKKTENAVETNPPSTDDDLRKKASDTGSNPGAQWTPEAWVPGAAKR